MSGGPPYPQVAMAKGSTLMNDEKPIGKFRALQTLVEDYRYYYKNRTHQSQSRWNNRTEWKRPASKAE